VSVTPAVAQEQDAPTEISSWNQLQNELNDAGNGDEYRLVTDLTAASDEYDGIGDDFTPISAFDGHFDGGGHLIADLKIETAGNDLGLFGTITTNGLVENVVLQDITISQTGSGSEQHTGGLFGTNLGEVRRVLVTGTVSSDGTSSGSFNPGTRAGGLGGNNNSGTITECAADVDVDAPDGSENGGLVGIIWQGGVVEDSYALGDVTGTNDVGGLVGILAPSGEGDIRRSYAAGNVGGDAPSNDTAGGVAGLSASGGTITDTYWDIGLTEQETAVGDEQDGTISGTNGFGAPGDTEPAPEMQGAAPGPNGDETMSSLDFASTWHVVEEGEEINPVPQADGYPILQAIDVEAQLEPQGITSAPARNISIRRDNLAVTPTQIDAGADIEVSLDLRNTGNQSAGAGVTVSVDGDRRLSQVRGPIAPGESQSVTFMLTLSEPGERTISVAGVDETATVTVTGDVVDSSVTIENQQATGQAESVTVAGATAPEAYVIAVHEADDPDNDALRFAIRGVSEPFAASESAADVVVNLAEPITQSQTVTAMLHAVDEDAENNLGPPLTVDGESVSDTATLTVDTEGTDLERFDQAGTGTITFDDVLAAIEAHNAGKEIGGEPVTFDDVIAVIEAHNDVVPVEA